MTALLNRRNLLAAAAVASLALGLAPVAQAETKLVLSSWLPPKHPIVVGAIKPWAKQVEEVTEGRVKVRVLAKPLGAPPAHYDMAKDGVADITYGLHSFTKDDRFLRSRIGQFSFLGDDAVPASKAFWDVYAGSLDAQAEHQGVKLLGLFVHGPGIFHNNVRKIEAPDSFAGLKIRVPGGIYNTTWFLVMNESKWNALSAEDRAAIEGVSGAAFAELVGQAWNGADEKAIPKIEGDGIEIYDAPASVLEAIKTAAAKHEAAWADAVGKAGFDGSAALADFRKQTGQTN